MTRVLAISDSDSYLKWSVATLRALPAAWSSTQVVVKNPVLPSAEQARTAAGRAVEVLAYPALLRRLERERPDVVLLAASGPVVAALTAAPALRTADRPVLVSGLPGISVPATPRALTLRAGCDVFLLHSHREVAEFSALAAELGVAHRFGLATLPFLPPGPPTRSGPPTDGPLVFAAQAKVPVRREDREQILLALAQTGSAVVKLRALTTEWQTHHEPWPYPQLYAALVQAGRLDADALHFAAGSMTEALASARGLVTVSSTAALEAMAHGPAGAGPERLRGQRGDDQHRLRRLRLHRHPGRPGRRTAGHRGPGLDGRQLLPPCGRQHLARPARRPAGRPRGRCPAGAASGQWLPLVASAPSAPAGGAADPLEPSSTVAEPGPDVAIARVSSTRSHSSRTAPEPPGRLSTSRAARRTSGWASATATGQPTSPIGPRSLMSLPR